jgi:N-carbamoylputrescine amidase
VVTSARVGGAPDGGRTFGALAVQTGPAGRSLEDNLADAVALVDAAPQSRLIVFAELFARPFWCVGVADPSYYDWAEPADGPTVTAMGKLARQHQAVVIAPFFERAEPEGVYYNSAAVLGPDGRRIEGRLPDGMTVPAYRKNAVSAYRWDEQVNDEKFYFRPGPGFPVFDTPLGRVGVLICLDRWFPEAWRVLALAGADIICVVNASSGDVDDLFVPSMRTCAAQNEVFVVAVNRAGVETVADRTVHYYGRSCVIGPDGVVLGGADHADAAAVHAEIDLFEIARMRRRRALFRDRRPELYTSLVEER